MAALGANLAAMMGQPVTPGLRVGLMGGSFNPAHEGHLHITQEALKRLGLDQVWWMVSPQNPLKPDGGMAPFADRFASAQAQAKDRRVRVTDIESQLGTQFTVDTISTLIGMAPNVRFAWVMGADNLGNFHRWKNWKEIAGLLPIAILARPGFTYTAPLGKAAQVLAKARIPAAQARDLINLAPPAWVFLPIPLHPASSTQIRHTSDWG